MLRSKALGQTRFRLSVLLASFFGIGLLVNAAQADKPEEISETIAKGKAIYERACLFCHGEQGKGDGPAAFFISAYSSPRPRDFTREHYKFRSTPSGELPTDEDLLRTVTNGIPGFMPPFQGLTEQERWQAIAYLKTFAPAFAHSSSATIPFDAPMIPTSPESIARGRTVYFEHKCDTCHGKNGTGDGPVARTGELTDVQGLAVTPTDMTAPSSFKNGARPHDILRSFLTGFDGTPMPSYAHAFQGREADAWNLVNYLRSLSGESRP